jgi:hypothetical protein
MRGKNLSLRSPEVGMTMVTRLFREFPVALLFICASLNGAL